ncbi:MAG: thiamine-phosphate kinase [Acidimicrobiales bacterium]
MQAFQSGEFDVIARIRERLAQSRDEQPDLPGPLEGEVYSGDDAAVLAVPFPGQLLVSIDLLVEGVHLDLSLGSLADAGWKAIAVNASDIAAMGGRPLHVVAGIAAPPGTDLDAIGEGMVEACSSYKIALVGGDLSTGGSVMLAVAITGTCDGRAPVLRSGAQAGDVIWVTGPLGTSAAGLECLRSRQAGRPHERGAPDLSLEHLTRAYRRPLARVREGMAAATAGATAMIDVSDGLSKELDHIGSDSGVGIRLHAVPAAKGASLAQALGGGEDYELVFTAPEGAPVPETFATAGLRPPARIGICSSVAGERLLDGDKLPVTGWEHSFSG